MTIRVVARIESKPETVEQVRELLISLVEPTRNETGCITYELLQNLEEPTDFTFVEEWVSAEALESHSNSEHLRSVGPKLRPITVTPPDIRIYKTIS